MKDPIDRLPADPMPTCWCRPAFPFAAVILAGLCLSLPQQGMAATKVGVTAAVNPQAEGAPPGEERRVLHVGIDMQANERVVTTQAGQAQLLFLDGSTLSIGPNSDLVLDRFVFDPDSGTGDLAITVGRGMFRFVGGQISKGGPVQINTGSATIGIRGGIATIAVDEQGGVRSGFLFGDQLTVTSEGGTQATSQPGTAIDADPGQPPSPPRLLSAAEIAETLTAFQAAPPSSETTEGGAAEGGGGAAGGDPDSAMAEAGVAGAASDDASTAAPAASGQGPGGGQGASGNASQVTANAGTDTAGQRLRVLASNLAADLQAERLADQAVEDGAGLIPPLPQPGIPDAGPDLPGPDLPGPGPLPVGPPTPDPVFPDPLDPEPDGPEPEPDPEPEPKPSPALPRDADGRLLRGPAYQGFNTQTLSALAVAANTPFLSSTTVAAGRLTVVTTTNETYDLPWTATGSEYTISNLTSTGPYQTFSGRMLAASDSSFWRAAGVAGGAQAGQRFVLFGGEPTELAQIPTGSGITVLSVGGSLGPLPFFGGDQAFGGQVDGVAMTPLYLRRGSGITMAQRQANQTPPVGYQASVMIDGTGGSQSSFLSGMIVTLVEEGNAGSGRVATAGRLLGSGRQEGAEGSVLYRSWLASADAGDHAANFGTTGQYMVLDPSRLSQAAAGDPVNRQFGAMLVDGPALTGDTSSSYPVILVQPSTSSLVAFQTNWTRRGFSGGIGTARDSGGVLSSFAFTDSGSSSTPGGLQVASDAGDSSITVDLDIEKVGVTGERVIRMGGGGSASGLAPSSAFVGNRQYLAMNFDDRMSEVDGGQAVDGQNLLLVTSQGMDTGQLELGANPCTCTYLDWGFWAGSLDTPGGGEERYHLAAWVAGDLPALVDMPLTGNASYTGQLIGTVHAGSSTYFAGSKMEADWSFGTKSGTFSVENFDSGVYSGTISSLDGRYITGSGDDTSLNRTMNLTGSFFTGASDAAKAMAGHFRVENVDQTYGAAGIFALDKNP